MTVFPVDISNADGGTPQPSKRKKYSKQKNSRLSLSQYRRQNNGLGEEVEVNMDSMSGITAFFPSSHRIAPFSKYEPPDHSRGSTTDDSPGSETASGSDRNMSPSIMATLANLGNTCFLNSVLYTLRFAPQFLHQLHHLVTELSSLRPINYEDATSIRSQHTQMVAERLHELYQALRGLEETKDMSFNALQPLCFLDSFRAVNPMFESHQQHDAHELLMCLLDNIKEACMSLTEARKQASSLALEQAAVAETKGPTTRSGGSGFKTPWSKNGKKYKAKVKEEPQPSTSEAAATSQAPAVPPAYNNFIVNDFEGMTVLITKCMECESVTERKEAFCDISMPIIGSKNLDDSDSSDEGEEIDGSKVFHKALLKPEIVRGSNKYWCEECGHLCEVQRTTRYETMPRILTLHLKRFISSVAAFSIAKNVDYMPTPIELKCFCDLCIKSEQIKTEGIKTEDGEEEGSSSQSGTSPHHSYQLFAAIMHLGSTMASGHYVSYVRGNENILDYCDCEIHLANFVPPSQSSGGILKFLKPKVEKNNISSLGANVCQSMDCCGIRMAIEPGVDTSVPEQSWLECDDDHVKVLSHREFEIILSESNAMYSSLTPYLLFYVRNP